MAISKVPDLPSNIAIVDPMTGYPSTQFQRWWQSSVEAGINALIGNANAAAAAAAANAAAIAASAAAATANTAATTANTAAAASAAAAAANAKEAALVNSYITPSSVLTCTTTTITIAAHVRNYADGTTNAILAGSVAVPGGTAPYTAYVSYADATRTNPTPTFVASTTAPTQGMDVHVVGAITVPATGTAIGGAGPRRPGEVIP